MKNAKFKPNEKEVVDEFFDWRSKAKFSLSLSENYDADYKIYLKEAHRRRRELTVKLAKINGLGRALFIWWVYTVVTIITKIDKIVKHLIDWFVDTGMFWFSIIGIIAAIYIICDWVLTVMRLMK